MIDDDDDDDDDNDCAAWKIYFFLGEFFLDF